MLNFKYKTASSQLTTLKTPLTSETGKSFNSITEQYNAKKFTDEPNSEYKGNKIKKKTHKHKSF